MKTLIMGPIRPRSGDLVLARVERLGYQTRLELPCGRKACLHVGDEIVVAYGDRYATDQFEAEVPPDLGPTFLVATGGVASRMLSRAKGIRPATNITPIGLVGDARGGVEAMLRGTKGCTVFQGHARFESPRDVRVGDDVLRAERIFINVGGRALVPDMPGVNDVDYLTNSTMLDLDVLPRHLVIVGGSYIGLEFAQMYRRFGAQVTVVEKGPRLIEVLC